MGCDIHPLIQLRKDDGWEDMRLSADHPLEARNYVMFAILADVRNYYGITPIAPRRGLPSDFRNRMIDDEHLPCENHLGVFDWHCDDCLWMGEHSHTWVTAREVAEYDWEPRLDNEFFSQSIRKELLEWLPTLGPLDDTRIVMGFDS